MIENYISINMFWKLDI